MLKGFIQRLLNTRTTPEEAAHSAMPSYDDNAVIAITPIKTTTDGWEKAASFVATCDGYLLVQGTARNDNVCQLSVDNSKSIKTVTEILRASATTYFVTPVTKGSTVQVFGHYMTNITIKLTKAIGGGYFRSFVLAVCKRGELCRLKALSLFSQKVSSKAKNLGLVSRGCRQLRRQLSLQRWTLRGELMSLQQTGIWFFMAERLNASCITRLVQALIMGASRVSLEDLYRFGRAAFCTITSKVRTAPQCSSLPHVSLSNLEKGGALC